MKKVRLSTHNLVIGYKNTALSSEINIDLKEGEITSVIGPNGSGKTTLIKTLMGQLNELAGDIFIDGVNKNLISLTEKSRKMAILLTERVRLENMLCRDVVSMGRFPYTGKLGVLAANDKQVVEASMRIIGIDKLAGKEFSHISDGQKQLILLARAIAQEPQILILDEPTSFLDIKYKIKLFDVLRNLADKRNITVLMSIHDISMVDKVSDSIIAIDGKHHVEQGAVKDFVNKDKLKKLFDLNDENVKWLV